MNEPVELLAGDLHPASCSIVCYLPPTVAAPRAPAASAPGVAWSLLACSDTNNGLEH